MTDSFKALVKPDASSAPEVRDMTLADLPEGDVVVRVSHSTINYKDGLALTGAAPILQSFPIVPGIDLAGTVESSDYAGIAVGDRVLVNGYGIGERCSGGLSQRARVKGEWLVPVPDPFSMAQAMAIGTAGYTAMLSVLALEDHGVTPDSGDVLVTGAAGGVGSVAIALLAKLGFRVVASTGRVNEAAYLKNLGAADVIDREKLGGQAAPISSETWAGAVDAVGSNTLANVLSQTRYGGTVACCGLAQGLDLPTSVLPFILRGVTLCGIESVMAPMEKRKRAWTRLARDLDPEKLDGMTCTIGLGEVVAHGSKILGGQVRGRVVVDVNA